MDKVLVCRVSVATKRGNKKGVNVFDEEVPNISSNSAKIGLKSINKCDLGQGLKDISA